MFKNANIVIISPHIDDAVFSLAGFINRYIKQNNISVINIFSISNFANETLFDDISDISLKRKKEDTLALSILGVKNITYLDIKEAPLRGYSLEQIFRNDNIITEQEQKVVLLIKKHLQEIITPETILLIPFCFGYHIDHYIANISTHEMTIKKYFYSDLPYASNNNYNNLYAKQKSILMKFIKIDMNNDEIEYHIELCKQYKTQYLDRFTQEIQGYLIKNGITLWY